MKDEYDFSTMEARKNPYAAKLKKSVTMKLSEDVILRFTHSHAARGNELIEQFILDNVEWGLHGEN